MKDNILNISFTKVGNNLAPSSEANKLLFKEFVENLQEGQVVKFFLEADNANQSTQQLAKIHVCIRKLATEMGYTFEEMKLEIKRRAGLSYGDLNTSEGYVKSFADCSQEEITLVFQALNEAGSMVNLQF
jgi:hypothetical protein